MSRRILYIFVTWRIFLFLVAGLAGLILPFTPSFPYSEQLLLTSGLPNFVWSFANFDGVHYITIAEKGYWAQFTQVFFPGYPLLVRLIMPVSGTSALVTGLVVSQIAFFAFLVIFSHLLRLDYSKETTLWTLLLVLFFPFSFFFGAMYSESLFLLLSVSAFLAARKKKWLLAGILGALSSTTRLAGFFLFPVLLIEYWLQNRFKGKYVLHEIMPLFLIPLGLLSYMTYLAFQFGDPLYFWHAQPVFGAQRIGNGIVLLPQVIYRYIKILTTVAVSSYSFWIAVWELISLILTFFFLMLAHKKKVRLSYLIFSWSAVILPSLTGTLSSMPRYILVAFPIYIAIALIQSKVIKVAIFIIFVILLGLFTALFTRGLWVG